MHLNEKVENGDSDSLALCILLKAVTPLCAAYPTQGVPSFIPEMGIDFSEMQSEYNDTVSAV